jgi:hypothetical protein
MTSPRLVFGLYEAQSLHGEPSMRARLRDLSLSWARFGYQGPVIEGTDAFPILDEALERGYEYCLLFATGTIFDENWYPPHWGRRDVQRALGELMDDGDFVAAGRLVEGPEGSKAIDSCCVLVNLGRYAAAGRPRLAGARLVAAEPAATNGHAQVGGPSWVLRDASVAACATYRPFDSTTALALVDLVSAQGDLAGVAPYLGRQIEEFPGDETLAEPAATAGQTRLLAKVRRQIAGAKRGVFPWNYESYDDVDLPPPGLESPLKSVYCVAAGFKSYRIVSTHGYDGDTRVVFFDYSSRALAFKQRLIADWDGAEFPSYLRQAFRELSPDTYFWLWADLSADQVATSDLDELWRAETDRWGGPEAFQKHWSLCRSLPHEFVLCDLVEDPGPLLDRLNSEPAAVIWWSNAFFTIYSNWFFTIAERRQRYLRFIKGLAERSPDLYLYGADHMNSSVNSIKADEYAGLLARETSDELMPAQFHRLQIRS